MRFVKNLTCSLDILFGNLDLDSTHGIGEAPINSHSVLIADENRNARSLQSALEQVSFFGRVE